MKNPVHVNKDIKKQAEKEDDCIYQMWNCIFIFNKWDGEEILYLKKAYWDKEAIKRWCAQMSMSIATWVQDLNLALEL